jgi:hypothetical protein
MAMIECKGCGKRVSNTKKKCRYCGAKVKRKLGLLGTTVKVIVVLAFVAILVPAVLRAISDTASRIQDGGIDTTITVPEGELYFHKIVLNRSGDLGVTAVKQAGPAVDVYFIDESANQKLQADLERVWISRGPGTVPLINGLSKEGLNGRFTSGNTYLRKGTYFVVVDNSDYGPTKAGGGSATVELKVQGK